MGTEFSKLIQKELEKLPSIIQKHRKIYKKYSPETSMDLCPKDNDTKTIITYDTIEYYNDCKLAWDITFYDSEYSDEYYNWFPDDEEYSFCTLGTCFYLNADDFFIAEYSFKDSKFRIDLTGSGVDDFEYTVKNVDDLREMLFTLSLDHANLISTEELWDMLSPFIELYKKISKGIDFSINYYPSSSTGAIQELNAEIPNL